MAERSKTLDILRAFAVTLVLFRHGVHVPDFSEPTQSLALPFYYLASNGWLGVDLFFVLSGYLLSTQILKALSRPEGFNPRLFLFQRMMRTAPAYLVVLIILWMGLFAEQLGTRGVGDVTALLSHLVFLNDYSGSPVLVSLWSLATEEKFYLVMAVFIPLLFRLPDCTARALLVTAITTVVIARTLAFTADPVTGYSAFFWQYRAPFHFATDGLLMGVLGGFLTHNKTIANHRIAAIAPLAIAFGMIILVSGQLTNDNEVSGALLAIPLFSASALALVLHSPMLDESIGDGIVISTLSFVARISYSLYLVHYPVARLTAHWLSPAAGQWESIVIFLLTYLMASLLAGWLLFLLIEKPGLRLRRKLTERYFPSSRNYALAAHSAAPAVQAGGSDRP